MAEGIVQTAKGIFKKVLEEKRDIYLALLQYRNMDINGTYSPAEILMSRKLRSLLPLKSKNLKPKLVDAKKYDSFLNHRQFINKKYFNKKGTQCLEPLKSNTKVFVQIKPNSQWFPCVVLQQIRDRVYKVKMESGSIYIRNRKFIKHRINNNGNHFSSSPSSIEMPKANNDTRNVSYYIDIETEANREETSEILTDQEEESGEETPSERENNGETLSEKENSAGTSRK